MDIREKPSGKLSLPEKLVYEWYRDAAAEVSALERENARLLKRLQALEASARTFAQRMDDLDDARNERLRAIAALKEELARVHQHRRVEREYEARRFTDFQCRVAEYPNRLASLELQAKCDRADIDRLTAENARLRELANG